MLPRPLEECGHLKKAGDMDGVNSFVGPTPSFPLPWSATSARWPCAFLNHQLQLWSCCEAMHRGTGVSAFVFIFDCLFLSNLHRLWFAWARAVHVVFVIIPSHPSVYLGCFHADRAYGA